MLSELILASTPTQREEKGDRVPGISGSALYPCPYRLYKVHTGTMFEEDLTPEQVLNMEDGWPQEEQAVQRLERAGIKIEDRQARLTLGISNIPGRPDGTFALLGEKYLWEFKAMNSLRFLEFTRWGLSAFPNYKAQTQGYLVGLGLTKACFQAKNKDTNAYHDIIEELDQDFILPIIAWADRIRLEGWEPKPELCKYCSNCGLGCFGEVLDFSWMDSVDEYEMSEKWKKGKMFRDGGQTMMDEAYSYFVGVKDKLGNWIQRGLIGDKEVLDTNGLNIRKITSHRFDINRQRVVQEFGSEGLMKVGEEKEIISYRIREVG